MKQRMWVHYCRSDRDWLWVGAEEECNWCGAREPVLEAVEIETEMARPASGPAARMVRPLPGKPRSALRRTTGRV